MGQKKFGRGKPRKNCCRTKTFRGGAPLRPTDAPSLNVKVKLKRFANAMVDAVTAAHLSPDTPLYAARNYPEH